jgi:hypothetical protein
MQTADDIAASFNEMSASVAGPIGMAIVPIGGGEHLNFGQWTTGPAWSTSKIPVILAAFREQGVVSPTMEAAITASDNTSAEEVWASLGDPETAKERVEAVLRDAGDDTVVETRRVRAEFTAFGQTTWPLTNQATFLSNVACDSRASAVLNLMGQIEPSQSWGLGHLTGAKFKGGWGPSESGAYLVRQFGVIPTSGGEVAVAIASEPASGSFDDGIQALNTIADWIADHVAVLPSGQCR